MTANFTDDKIVSCSHSLNNFTFNKYIVCKDRDYFPNFQIFQLLFQYQLPKSPAAMKAARFDIRRTHKCLILVCP